ncbi:formylglycine-generating enzyme required for sulfatase activity [Marichromatium gracile]|uniref:Formylglycine-generating enzyme required for sulfatase activity n=2 Tax=Chromatiaceae TaxID=1046 RepID=A0A4R4A7V9_MARGR|nr:Sulphatase-modifying factor protein [Marichromatium gracile]RNE89436.1 formylglycine-generating enzyme family protein [Marichromatium sp. AB31]TCW34938.1 formylglycine-generating enzyme required for sulfatase activity [Marichromatium gracile]
MTPRMPPSVLPLGVLLVGLLLTGASLAAPPATDTNALGMTFRLIPAGSFQMGCDTTRQRCDKGEQPVHRVTIAQPFYLAETEVTQRQWQAVMGENPSHFKDPDNPVEQVSWEDAQAFVRALNQRPDLGGGYRLPSEAEWEYATRAGTQTDYWFGDGEDERALNRHVWHLFSSREQPHPVASKPANPWGLYEVHGNVWEWVADCAHPDYVGAPSDGSAWTQDCQRMRDGTPMRIARGGAWYLYPNGARSAFRFRYGPDIRHYGFGLRLARSVETETVER